MNNELTKIYEDGKKRRYNLLFAVNGGAFVVAKIIHSEGAIGGLSLDCLCLGMVAFTFLMGFDIMKFGVNMHEENEAKLFERPGRFVLAGICIIICLGWALASYEWQAFASGWLPVLKDWPVVPLIVLLKPMNHKSRETIE